MRIIDFFDGAQSETAPTIGNIVASGIIKYPDDATYEASEQGSPACGNIYYNTTTDLLRYYNGTEWIDIVDDKSLQTIINKTIDADNNTILNIEDDNIKAGAAIDVTKLHDGSVDNTEFGHLDGVTSPIQTQLDGKQDLSEKGQPNGYASLDGSGQVPASQLPSFVDDVLEFADLASFPATGETGKIYVALDDNKTYRWTGSVYVEVGPASRATNNQVVEGGTWSTTPGANGTIDQAVGGSDFNFFNTTDRGAQGFDAFPQPLTAVVVQLKTIGNPVGPLKVNIHSDASGSPGSIIGTNTNTLLVDSWPSTYASATFFFDFLSVPTGDYYFSIDPSSLTTLDASNHIAIEGATTDPDPGQGAYGSGDGGATWSGPTASSDYRYSIQYNQGINLTFDAEAYVQVEGLSNDANTLQPTTVALPSVDSIAYVSLNKDNNTPTNIAIQTGTMSTFVPGDDDLIIARKVESGIEVSRKLHLELNESAGLQDGIIPNPDVTIPLSDIALIGAGTATFTGPSTSGSPVSVYDQPDESGNYALVPNAPAGFTFTSGSTGPLQYVETTVDPGLLNGDGNTFAELYAVDGTGLPTGSPLDTSSTTATSSLGSTQITINYVFNSTATITNGQDYAIIFTNTDSASMFLKVAASDLPGTANVDTPAAWNFNSNQNSISSDVYISGATVPASLTLDEDIYISVPPALATSHTIDAQAIQMDDDQVAFIDVDPGAFGVGSSTVVVDDVANITPSPTRVIFARVTNGVCHFGIHDPQRIEAGETIDVQVGGNQLVQVDATNQINIQTVYARSSRAATVTQTPSSSTVPFDIIEADNFNGFNATGNIYTIPRAQRYRIRSQALAVSTGVKANQDLWLLKNQFTGAVNIAQADLLVDESGGSTIIVETIHDFEAGDTIQVASNNSQSGSLFGDSKRMFFEIESVPDFTLYGAVTEQEYVESQDTQQNSVASPVNNTWYIPSVLTLTLSAGTWDVDLETQIQGSWTGSGFYDIAISDSATPGNSLLRNVTSGIMDSTGDYQPVRAKLGNLVLSGTTTLYIHVRPRAFSGGATPVSLFLRNDIGSPGILSARRIK